MKAKQKAVMAILCTIGFGAFLIVCSEGNSAHSMSDRVFYESKIAAGAIFLLCVVIGKFLQRTGWFPGIDETEKDHWED